MTDGDGVEAAGMDPLAADLSRYESLRQQRPAQARRRYQRFVVRGDAVIEPLRPTDAPDGPTHIMLRDVAPGGVGFVCPTRLDVRSRWQISFLDRQCTVARQPVIVGHCCELRPGVFLVGGPFCAETGLLNMLGVDPAAISSRDGPALAGDTAFDGPTPDAAAPRRAGPSID